MFIVTIILCSSSVNIFANSQYREDFPTVPKEATLVNFVDNANILTKYDGEQILKKLDIISEKNKCDVIIVTVDSLDGKDAKAYADDFYDNVGYGYGENDDGILFLVSTSDRKWAISTFGFGITAFTDKGQEYIIDEIKPYLSEGNFNSAFSTFADLCDQFLVQARTDKPYDKNNMPFKPLSINWIFIALGSGAVISLIITLGFKRQLKTIVKKDDANSYVIPKSLNMLKSRDIFLYSNITKTPIPKNNGGSSTNTSSSGRSHGGSSGSF